MAKYIVSGGGTGGHIFPAISIANALKKADPQAEILFVGAEGKMEMEKVPAEGYKIIGLPITGFDRKSFTKNISLVKNLFISLKIAKTILTDFKPDICIGVGGYASGPLLYMANRLNIPTVIQEQNSYAGVTNKILSKRAKLICVAYQNMEKFFPKDKIVITGNPIRQSLTLVDDAKKELAIKEFRLEKNKKTVVIIGGSLGARTVNDAILSGIDEIAKSDIQIVWQCGKIYHDRLKSALEARGGIPQNVKLMQFISDMGLAYSIADLVISRAGASSISELCILGKAVILIPSPNVAEDHQTQNALALSSRDAAILIKDIDAVNQLVPKMLEVVSDDKVITDLKTNILKLALPDSASIIAKKIIELINHKKCV